MIKLQEDIKEQDIVSEINRINTLNIYLPVLASLSLFKGYRTIQYVYNSAFLVF